MEYIIAFIFLILIPFAWFIIQGIGKTWRKKKIEEPTEKLLSKPKHPKFYIKTNPLTKNFGDGNRKSSCDIIISNFTDHTAYDCDVYINTGKNGIKPFGKNMGNLSNNSEPFVIHFDLSNLKWREMNNRIKDFDYLIKFRNSEHEKWYYRNNKGKESYHKDMGNFKWEGFSKIVILDK